MRSAWFPTLSGVAEEKFTNATVFTGGHSAVYLLQLMAKNRYLNTTILLQLRAQDAVTAQARAREGKARQAAEDAAAPRLAAGQGRHRRLALGALPPSAVRLRFRA